MIPISHINFAAVLIIITEGSDIIFLASATNGMVDRVS